MKLPIEALARLTPAASRGLMIDSTPSSVGGITPVHFHHMAISPWANGYTPTASRIALVDRTPTPFGSVTVACFQLATASSKSPKLSPFGVACVSEPASSGVNICEDHHVRVCDPVTSFPLVSDSVFRKNAVTQSLLEIGDDEDSTCECSFSTCTVGNLPSSDLSIKNTFIHVNSDESDSEDDFYIPIQKSKSLPNALSLRRMDMSSMSYQFKGPGTDLEDQLVSMPRAQRLPSADVAKQQQLPSAGAALHGAGNCKPCVFFWKPEGCNNGVECFHCHACPEGEIKRRKKTKIGEMKKAKRMAKLVNEEEIAKDD